MHLSKVIEKFGYSKNEVRVYLAALSRGESMVSDLSALLKLPRSRVQLIVEKLQKDGLMNVAAQRRYKYWVAENPERLLIGLKEKEAALKAVMPELSVLRREGGAKPTVKVFRGVEEIKLIYEDILATKHPILAIIAWDRWVELFGEEYLSDFTKRRIAHFLRLRLLVAKSAKGLVVQKGDARTLRVTRFLPGSVPVSTTNFIYGNKIAIISLNKKEPTGS
ncbi:MAG: Transcriptional regulator TrmB [Parcubacteria group bacterium GW2011_GWA2_49_9]|nr:MAG: Transcriptional regulator TrmB [Parcubacteria group bacterium GW2011_GWA2_49_9]